MKTEMQEIFVAEDGEKFTSDVECLDYEKELRAQNRRLKTLKAYRVSHSFDATEGKGYFGASYILTDFDFSVVLQYCINRWGQPLSQWYGDSYYSKWKISESETQIALSNEGEKPYQFHRKTDLVFISKSKIPHDQIPDPTFPWPLKARTDIAQFRTEST